MKRHAFLIGAVVLGFVFSLACGLGRGKSFQVIAQTPSDALRSPEGQVTPFPDILRQFNQFVAGSAWVGLRPGMELRVENAYYQKGFSRRGLSGYLGTEVARYQVLSLGLNLTDVQPLASRLGDDPAVQTLISASDLGLRYYRLYYEVFNRAKNTRVSVLAGSDTAAALEQAEGPVEDAETICGAEAVRCSTFPESCSVSVEMRVMVNGQEKMIAWGSLLKSVVSEHPRELAVWRLHQGRPVAVQMKVRDAAVLQLPLLPGDRVKWR